MLFSGDHIFFSRGENDSIFISRQQWRNAAKTYLIAVAFKSRFEEMIAKGKIGPVPFLREACRRSVLRADRMAQKADIESIGAILRR
jgi:hypothetical protein